MRSSRATASAQLISLPADFQFRRSHQVHHLSPRIMPMPTDELASEKPLTSVICRPPGILRDREGCERICIHQSRSSEMDLGGCRGTKGCGWSTPIIFSNMVR